MIDILFDKKKLKTNLARIEFIIVDKRIRMNIEEKIQKMDLITNIFEVMGMDITVPERHPIALWQSILWQIYYDFYYPWSPTFMMASINEPAQIQEIVAALKALPCDHIQFPLLFCLQKITPRTLKTLYLTKGPLASWLVPFAPAFHHLLRAVKKGHHYNVVYYIHKLFQDGVTAEEVVTVLCAYFKVPFVPVLPYKRSDLQYVLAVYVRFQVAMAMAEASATDAVTNLLPYIAEESPAAIIKNIMSRLKGDPVLIDMKERQVPLTEVGEYILSCLNTQEEVDLYTGVPTKEAEDGAAGEDGEVAEAAASAADMNLGEDAFEGLNNSDNILDMVGRRWIKQVFAIGL